MQLYVGMNNKAIEILRRWVIQDAKGTEHTIELEKPAADIPTPSISRAMPKDWHEIDVKTRKPIPLRQALRATVVETPHGNTIHVDKVQMAARTRVISTDGGKR